MSDTEERDLTETSVNHHMSEAHELLYQPQSFMLEETLDKGCTYGDVALRSIAHSLYAIATILEDQHFGGSDR
jgi:hypothetical protein